MAIVKTMGVIIVVLLALWIIFSLIGVLTAIIKAVLVILIVVAICYGVFHFFKKH
jgi:fumarate reductase subunit D